MISEYCLWSNTNVFELCWMNKSNSFGSCLLWYIRNAFMQALPKITINKNLINKVTSFWLRFVTKRDFDCEQVEQQTSQTELKHVSVVWLSEIRPLRSQQLQCCIQLTTINYCIFHMSAPRMYINILLDTVLATDVNKYSLAPDRCQPIWRTHMANWIYF